MKRHEQRGKKKGSLKINFSDCGIFFLPMWCSTIFTKILIAQVCLFFCLNYSRWQIQSWKQNQQPTFWIGLENTHAENYRSTILLSKTELWTLSLFWIHSVVSIYIIDHCTGGFWALSSLCSVQWKKQPCPQ